MLPQRLVVAQWYSNAPLGWRRCSCECYQQSRAHRRVPELRWMRDLGKRAIFVRIVELGGTECGLGWLFCRNCAQRPRLACLPSRAPRPKHSLRSHKAWYYVFHSNPLHTTRPKVPGQSVAFATHSVSALGKCAISGGRTARTCLMAARFQVRQRQACTIRAIELSDATATTISSFRTPNGRTTSSNAALTVVAVGVSAAACRLGHSMDRRQHGAGGAQ